MTKPIITAENSISPGDIQFYSSIQPPLTAGDYTLKGSQSINKLDEGAVAPYDASQPFTVTAPQFVIDPSMIHSVYPPKGQTGNYYKQMPFMVFNNFALPWARNIDPNGGIDGEDSPPWMGILLAYDTDMAGTDPNVGSYDQATDKWIGPVQVDAADVITPATNVVVPALSADQIAKSPDKKAMVLEMKYSFFQDIAPTLEELPLLAHARGVNTDGKIMLGMDADGLFSVLVSNRVPPANGGGCTAFLVSLEGHQDHLPTDSGNSAEPDQKIRLVMLGAWDFTASQSPGSFRQLMINVTTKGGGVKLLQAPGNIADITNSTAKEAIEIGYVALANDLRIGEKSTSWYRGPCVPAPTRQNTDYAPYHYSDHAIQYDPETGIFDQSYACAWQVGRMLALSDSAFAQSLYDWRRSYLRALQSSGERSSVEQKLAPALSLGQHQTASKGAVSQLHSFLQTVAAADEPVFPQVNVRTPLTASTRPKPEIDSDDHTSDPLLNMVLKRRKKEK